MSSSSSVIYGVDAAPPPQILWLNALQHISLSAVTLIFPRMVAESVGADAQTVARYVSLSMVAMGLVTLIQAYGRRGIGSGYLLLGHCTILYLPFALEAARVGGLGAVAGLTIVAGCTEMLLSRSIRGLRAFIPPEIIGVVILLLGATLGVFGLRLMLGIGPGSQSGGIEIAASAITLATTIGVATWARPKLRSLALLVGVATGCTAFVLLAMNAGGFAAVGTNVVLVSPRWPLELPSAPIELLPGFLIGALACFVRAIADITACQQLADPNWRAPDLQSIRAGTFADGLGCVVAGVVGVLGTNTYSGSIGLATANGVMARRVGIAAGTGWIVLGLLPGAASVIDAIPAGVFGAACFYSATFTIRTGIAMLSQRLIDSRRTLVIGSAVAASMLVFDQKGSDHLPLLVHQLLSSPLASAMFVALALNAVLRLGIPKEMGLSWLPSSGFGPLRDFAETQGRAWGSRVDLIGRATALLEEFSQLASRVVAPGHEVAVHLRHDDVGLRISLSWVGEPMAEVGRSGVDTDPNADDGTLEMILIRHWADEIRTVLLEDGRWSLVAHIDEH